MSTTHGRERAGAGGQMPRRSSLATGAAGASAMARASWLRRLAWLSLFNLIAPPALGVAADAVPLPAEPVHGRPYLMPPGERQRIRDLAATTDWGRREFEQLHHRAAAGDGHAAAFLFAVERDAKHLPAAKQWLLAELGPSSYWVKRYSTALADPEFFRGGQKNLEDVYYQVDTQRIIGFDWVFDGLTADDRRVIRDGLLTCARYRMRAMDRWTQTPNLVFKPTFVVALTGLVTRDPDCLEWGFRRTRPWGARLGGYFAVLDHMLYDGGVWHEAPIYPAAHRDLLLAAEMSRFLELADGQDWFHRPLPGGGSPRGLMDYYLDTAYPIERQGNVRRIRVATFGDGATHGRGDLFLIHAAPGEKPGNLLLHEPLAAAYAASQDPRYAAFLALQPDYRPSLWEHPPLPSPPPPLPPAPSKVWPRFGLAMLRSDESPNYWTSGEALAVLQIMSRGYGHDHRDKFSLALHGAGRLFYPDYNAIQYENLAIGWTRNSVSHNTLLVDEQDGRDAEPTGLRYDFNPDVKFLATAASGVFEVVEQTRALLLAREYLLDIFHATSPIPHTYDYLLHGFGRAAPQRAEMFRPSDAMKRRFWLIEDQRSAAGSGPWAVDFILDDEPPARLRWHLAAGVNTQLTIGRWGAELARRVEEKGSRLDDLAMIAARRSGTRQTVFVSTHEPVRSGREPQVARVTTLAELADGALVRVDGSDFTDYAAVRFGADPAPGLKAEPLHFNFGRDAGASIGRYGYLRVTTDGRLLGRGDWGAFRLPLGPSVRQFTMNGSTAVATRSGDTLVYGDPLPAVSAADTPVTDCPFPVRVVPAGPLRMFARDRRELVLEIKNTLDRPLAGYVTFATPQGVTATPKVAFQAVAPGATVRLPFTVQVGDPAQGRQTLTYRVAWTDTRQPPVLTAAQPLVVFAGPTLLNEYANRQSSFVVYSPKFVARFDMFHGLCRYLADDGGMERLSGTPLFTLSDGKSPLLHEGTTNAFTWPREAPADLVAHAYDKCRWQSLFYGGRMAIRMDRGWTQFERAHFTIPGRWTSPGGPPRWRRVVAVDSAGNEHDVGAAGIPLVSAAELEFPGGQWNLAFKFEPPQEVRFRGLELNFSIGSWTGDNWQIGFCRPDEFDVWRGKASK